LKAFIGPILGDSVETMTSVSVTPAGHGDMDSFVASVIGLFREDAGRHDPSMDVAWPVRDGMAYYNGLLSEEFCLLAVARDGDLIVGHLVGKLLEPDALRLQRFAVLESMRVDPSMRGRGIGGTLIEYFLEWARQRGAQQASVTAFAANQPAQRLYQRHGFTPSAVTMRTAV
jgi:GNAT superfamily N-acetyltransferase